MTRLHGPWPLRALKIASAVLLGTPATLVWLPFMVPLAFYGPFLLVRDAFAGNLNPVDLRGIAVAVAGTAGLVGFWLWVFDHPGRSARMQRCVGLLWLAGAVAIGAYLTVPNLGPMADAVTVVFTVTVLLIGLAMVLRPRTPPPRAP